MTGIVRGLNLVVASAISLGIGLLQTRDAPRLASRAPKVDAFLASRRAPFPFSGSVLIAIDGRMVLDKGYGGANVPGRARGYDIKDGVVRDIKYKDHGAFAAGGLLSSTHDLWAFADAFFSRRLLSSSAVLDMLAPGPGDYGLGWQIKRYFGRPMVNHSGGIDGFASHLAVYPDERLVIVVLSNIESEPAKSTACNIAAVLFDAGSPSGCPAS